MFVADLPDFGATENRGPGAGSPDAEGQRARAQRLLELHRCVREVGLAPHRQTALDAMAHHLATLLSLQRSWVVLVQEGAENRECVALYGGDACHRGRKWSAPATSWHLTLPMVVEHPEREGLLPHGWREGDGPLLVVPLLNNRELQGLLLGDRGKEPLHPSPLDLEMAGLFAAQAEIWLHHAELLRREQHARAKAEAAEHHFRNLLESSPDANVLVDEQGLISLVNSQAERLFGYTRDELIGSPIEVLLPPAQRAGHVALRNGYLDAPRTRPIGVGIDLLAQRKDGTQVPVEISLSPSRDGDGLTVIAVVRDVTERVQAEEERARLFASERAKSEQLKLSVREAHHRIKNNLQAISDLLYLESSAGQPHLRDPKVAESLRECRERVQAIALVHDLLSQEDDVRTVDVRALLNRLVPMVLRSVALKDGQVQTQVEAGPFPLSSKRATALALIVNELVSNAAKHAFPGGRPGKLTVSLLPESEEIVLRVCDDGPGLPTGFDLQRTCNVGLEVVKILAERDLGGRFALKEDHGLTAEVRFVW